MGNWFSDAIEETANFLDRNVDRYINPFHVDIQTKDGKKIQGPNNGALGPALNHSMESFFHAVNWTYSNGFSQPVATVRLQAQRDPGKWVSAAEWSRAWRAAEHISFAQVSPGWLNFNPETTKNGMEFDLLHGYRGKDTEKLVNEAIDSPLVYFTPPKANLPADWDSLPPEEQQRLLKEAGMPAVGNKVIERLRDESMSYRYGTGVEDAFGRWFADPTIIGGKAVGAAREARVVMRRPAGGWSAGEIDKIVNSSKMSKLFDFLEKHADNPQVVNNTDMATKSAMGPRMGAINSVLRDNAERQEFIRAGMGDVAAQQRLMDTNALARQRIETDTSRLAAIDIMYARYAGAKDPRLAALAKKEQDRLNESISADSAMVDRYDQILAHKDELDEINLSRWSFARAEARTDAQNAYLARPARGGSFALRRGGKGMAARQFRATATPPIYKVDPATGGPATRAVESGFVATRLWGVGDFFTTPVTLVRMMKHAHPNGYMTVDQGTAFEAANVNELRAQVARIPGIRQETRQNIINQYLQTASEAERVSLLEDMGRLAAGKIAARHGLSAKAGLEIYDAQRTKLLGEVDNMRQYSAAQMPREGDTPLRVDAFETEGGIKIEPHTVSRIVNSHVLPDLDQFNRTLARHSGALRTLRESYAGNPDWILAAGDHLSHLWKFATLFRLGYIPRTVGDDLASQWARLGTAAMAMRAGYGVKNGLTNLAHREARTFNEIKEKTHVEGMKYAADELNLLRPEMKKLGAKVATDRTVRERAVLQAENRLGKAEARLNALPTTATATARRAHEIHVERLRRQLSLARKNASAAPAHPERAIRLRDMELRAATLRQFHDLSAKAANDAYHARQKIFQGADAIQIGDTVFPAAFGGQRGDYYMQRISPNEAYDQLFKTNKQLIHANLMRSFDHGARPIQAIDDEAKHADAWAHAINAQIAGDKMQRKFLEGWSEEQVAHWLKSTPEGMGYMKRLNLKFATPEDIAAKGRFEVDDYLPLPEIRQQALTPEGVTPGFLTKAVPRADHRPTVHMANLGHSPLAHWQAMDRIMQSFYNVAVTLPAKSLSRHPLFNQLYEGHLKTIVAQRAKQGAEVKTVADIDQATESARRLAERDTKRLVFDIAHRSDASAALRFLSPFFSATAESFQRWGRVIADRPEVLGYAQNFYNAPAYLGHMQDQDGNRIFPDGTVVTINPKTGKAERKLTAKGDRYIIGRLPEWLIDSPVGIALGVERSSGNLTLSQNSINIVTQGDPWFSPGVGPVVQIPVNEFVKDKPKEAELARQLGILPFGPATGDNFASRAVRQAAPATLRHFLTAFDTSDYRYQQVKQQIMQRATFEHEVLGKPMLSAQEIADRARNYWFFSAGSAFLQPMATKRRDAYQYYRDQYNNLRRSNPETADQEFRDRFGEDYFIFAQSMSKNVAGIPATNKAVELSQRYAGILAKFPELGPLVIGPEGNGPFSPEAYAYQLNTPLVPGDQESQRRRLTAEESVKENGRRKGWAKFTQAMNWINSELVKRNLPSLDAPGAEDLALVKRAVVMALGEPTMPNGDGNPLYNEEWSKDYYSFDARKYERLVPALSSVAKEVLKKDPERGDMRKLLQYLEGRKYFVQVLKSRPFNTLGAKANSDLRAAWTGFVGSLVESNTDFGDLYHRYLSRDLGVDVDEEAALMTRPEEEGL